MASANCSPPEKPLAVWVDQSPWASQYARRSQTEPELTAGAALTGVGSGAGAGAGATLSQRGENGGGRDRRSDPALSTQDCGELPPI